MIDALIRALAREKLETPTPIPPGVAVRRASWLPAIGGALSRMGRPAAAVTLGRTIVVHPDVPVTPRLLKHELTHVKQWQQNPFTFPARYVWNFVLHGYEANPYEMEARAAEEE